MREHEIGGVLSLPYGNFEKKMPKTCVLVVEDEPISLETLTENLVEDGYEAVSAASGEAAWSMLLASPERFSAILLDRMMPDIDGIEILRRMKAHPQFLHTPVIMQTGMAADGDVAAGLRAGAYYYLTKPFSADTLLAIVAAAINDCREYRELQREARRAGQTLLCLQSACFVFRSPEEARNIAALAANAAPDPERVVLGLSELMLNAVEHGNLGIGYQEKSLLIEDASLSEEIARRLAMPAYAAKHAELVIERSPERVSFLIRDQGGGFDWQRYLEMSPERAFDTHGRGIALSRLLSFDSLEYRGWGNEVLACIRL